MIERVMASARPGLRWSRAWLAVLLWLVVAPLQAMSVQDLGTKGHWQLRLLPGSAQAAAHPRFTAWQAAQVPGTVHTDLFKAGLIADPYVGAPEAGLQWIGLGDWEYRLVFDADAAARQAAHTELVFDGLDTFAEVTLNGARVLQADNAFRQWRVPVTGPLRATGNELRVVLRSPIATLLPKVQAMPVKIAGNYPSPYGDEPRDAMTANFVRKPGYHYGWDWGPRYVTAGVWQPVRLESWDTLRVADLHLRQDQVTEQVARLTAHATLEVQRAGDYQARLWQTAPDGTRTLAAQQRVTLAAGQAQLALPAQVARPARWYPAGYGAQPLYGYTLELLDDQGHGVAQVTRRTGLRSVELRREADAGGRSFEFVINGIPVFAKGANVIPFDMFVPRVTHAQLRRVLQSAVDANMNMVRNWGGGYYESDDFFDIADELGLLVWQDFMFGGGMQPAYDPAFRANVVEEARQQVIRLRNHPSLVLWCGNNEEETAWKSWGQGKTLKEADPAFAQRVWEGYVQLFGTDLREVVAREGGGIAYWASSPSDDLAEQANIPSSGDMHYWEVWGNPARPPTAYLDITPRFMSEYGLQAWPALRTIDAFATKAEQGVDTPVIRAHQKFMAGEGNTRLLHYIAMEFGQPRDFPSFVQASQAMQAEGIALAALHHRASRPHTMGSLYWQLNDVWPGASWSSVDWFGRWKALQFQARRFFAPVTVAALRAQGETEVSVISDRTTPRTGTLRLRVMDLDGKVLREERRTLTLAPLSATQVARYSDAQLLRQADPARTVAVFELQVPGEPDARQVVYFKPAYALAWSRAKVQVRWTQDDSGLRLELSSPQLARMAWIDFGALDAQVSDNALTLLPGEPVVVRVASSAAPAALKAALRVSSVADVVGPAPASPN